MITFIIPTIGRDTLEQSVQSIINQTNNNWKILIVFDGIRPTITMSHPNINIIVIDKKGEDKNSAGNVRNEGLKFVDTKWVGFLDDDDTIASDYVSTFFNEINNYPNTDLLIFRMYKESENKIYPKLNVGNFYINDVGISFIVKKQIFEKIKFQPSSQEDFYYLNKVRNDKYVIMISPYIKYFVNGIKDINKKFEIGNRVILNDEQNMIEAFTNQNMIEAFTNQNMIETFTNQNMIYILLVFAIILLYKYNSKIKNKYVIINSILFIIIIINIIIINYSNKEGLQNNYKYTAIIIEPREHKALEFVLQNFNDNLSDEWQFIVFHGNKNKEYTEKICKKVFIPERVKIVDLKVDDLNQHTYSGVLLEKSFYDNIKTEHFLVFQTDSIICGKYKKTINDFLQYDYVGAPYGDNTGVGNGGLSLRKKSKMLEILNKCKIKDDKNNYLMEDRVFSYGCDNIDIHLPSIKEANDFSIESTMSNKSFGIHKAYHYLNDTQINAINEWCPEINKLAELNN